MAAVATIQIVADDSGVKQTTNDVQQTFQRTNDNLRTMGNTGEQAFGKVIAAEQKAHASAKLLEGTLGIEVPRALGKVIANSQILGPIFAGAFNIAIFAAVVPIVEEIGTKIKEGTQWLGGYTEAVRDFYKELIADNQKMLAEFSDKTIGQMFIAQTNLQIEQIEKQKEALEKARDSGDTGILGKVAPEAAYAIYTKMINDISNKEVGLEKLREEQLKKLTDVNKEETEKQKQEEIKAWNERQAIVKQATNELAAIHTRATEQGVSDSEKATLVFIDEWKKTLAAAQAAGASREETERRVTEVVAGFSRERSLADEKEAEARDKADAEAVAAIERRHEELARKEQERQRVVDDATINTKDLEAQAAADSVPPWMKANDEIIKEYQRRYEEAQKLSDAGVAMEKTDADRGLQLQQLASRQMIAADADMTAKIREQHQQMVDELAGELQSWGDDLFNGKIGQHILDAVKHLFYQILANWLLTLNQMGSAGSGSGGGGGLLQSIFGGLFGKLFGNGGGSGGGGAFGVPLPGMGDGLGPLEGMSAAGAAGGTGLAAGFGSLAAMGAPGAPGLGNMLGDSLSGGAGTAGMVAQQSATQIQTSSILGALTGGTLSKIFPNGIQLGKFGMSGSQLGTMGVGLGIASAINAYQSGSVTQGAIGGALGGIMTGFAIGGPVGAAVGGLIFLGNIIAGLFGRNAKKRQAQEMGASYLKSIQDTRDQYMKHQMDFNSANSTLDSIANQAQGQMFQLGGVGKSAYWNQVNPKIVQARTDIQSTEGERGRRGAIDYQAPEFHTGGYIGPELKSNELMIKAKTGEFVVNPQATAMNRATLEAMNSGRAPSPTSRSGGTVHLIIQAIDVQSFRQWLRSGAAREIKDALSIEDLQVVGGGN
ncbi:hypothetical protein Acid345_3420 [Candidatus Koribacter versatilis Ellin345]|uniref:Uncharacterized protein n=1 Tax=Koribacter versatilis (strain Ellin345) TaxID=204669 RepID=Q1IL29_KORVE|nr:hypothetical protein [Candidatus Koribacter versatilis]ABF42421.1 hypothetical protein Acid345_3420 [Candidatus Koribacter versatilis Ellin345]